MTLSLRTRLLVGVVALTVLGLAVADIATYKSLESFLLDRVNQQLHDGVPQVRNALTQPVGGDGHFGAGPPASLPPGTYAALALPDGTILIEQVPGFGSGTITSRPTLPKPLPNAGLDKPTLLTLSGSGGVSQYRVLVQAEDSAGGNFLVIGVPLTEVQSTLRQLLGIEASITAGVLLAMALMTIALIRVGLRPLDRMGQTADAIAGGDLTRRVEPATSQTEIGRLGLALNKMLTQIEIAFNERLRSEQQLRQFLADASHELRTPLTSIRGYAEMLRRGAQDSPEDSALARRRIEEESKRMTVLVEDLLLLARLDQGRPLQRDPVHMQAVVLDAFSDARAVAPERPITMSAPDPVNVTGDDLRLRQVVGNLVRNALVHTPGNSPVEISLATRDGQAVLTVVDHGPGLSGAMLKRAFEPFYRADPSRSRDRGGSGLGLSIAAAVVAEHGGEINVSQTPGGGATFEVRLPAAALAPQTLPAAAASG